MFLTRRIYDPVTSKICIDACSECDQKERLEDEAGTAAQGSDLPFEPLVCLKLGSGTQQSLGYKDTSSAAGVPPTCPAFPPIAHAVPQSHGARSGKRVPRSAAASLSALRHQLSVITVIDMGRKRHANDRSPFCEGRATKPALGSLPPTQHPHITSCLPLTVENFAAADTRTAVKKN